MPIQDHFELPKTAQELPLGDGPAASLFLCYISSVDPVSKQPWCPDVRAALPRLDKTFSSQDAPRLAYVHVGQKPEWKALDNVYRKEWNINAVPTLVRYQKVGGQVKETGRLVEAEVVNDSKFSEFIRV